MAFKNTKQPVLYALCGLPGAGKSTVARELEKSTGAIRLNVDEWVAALDIDFWDDEFRHKLDGRLYSHGLTLLEHGQSIIVEDNLWTRGERDKYRKIAQKLNVDIELHYFDVPFDELWRRLQIRNSIGAHGTVPITKELLEKCWSRFEQMNEEESALFTRVVVHCPEETPLEMKAKDAAKLYRLFEDNGIQVWIDGGWAVDALVGKQTRKHDDLDIAMYHKDVPKLRSLLETRGYRDVPRDDAWEHNFVLGDGKGHQLDIHSFELDKHGKNALGVAYEAKHFGGEGSIDGQTIRCINPETLVEFHTGYPLDDNDHHDVLVLSKKFNIPLPEQHEHWEERRKIEQAIRSLELPKNCPAIIAISGFGGSGKTTLAAWLKQQLKDARVVSIDSFSNHKWHRNADWDNFDRSRFAREVLKPARANKFPLRFVHEPWPGNPEETITVPHTSYLIVEGCSIFHPDLLGYYDFKIWVGCPLEEATRRGMWRDRHIHKDEQDYYWQNIWMPNERDFYDKYHPDKTADMTLNTN